MTEKKRTPDDVTRAEFDAFVAQHGLVRKESSFSEPQQFQITSGCARITDPCYSTDTWCSGEQRGVFNGTWHARAYEVVDDMDWSYGIKWAILGYEQIEQRLAEALKQFREGLGEPKHPEAFEALVRRDFMREHERRVEGLKNARGRINLIYAYHDYLKDDPRFAPENVIDTIRSADESEIHVGVDSGQAGFFDRVHYPEGGSDDRAFYEAACDLTLGPGFGVVEHNGARMGFVSSSGYGDGGYSFYTLTDAAGFVVFMAIVFIGQEDEDEEEALEEAEAEQELAA